MKVRPRYDFEQIKSKQSPNPTARPIEAAQTVTWPAPIRGWILNENIATPQPGGAARLDNWFCTPTGVRMRRGATKIATIGDDEPVQSLMAYVAADGPRLFGATTTEIFNITSIADPDTIPTADVTGQAGGYYSSTSFETAGGNFLIACNGLDAALTYDGAAWSAASITGVVTSSLSAVWGYANRLFFVQRGTMFVWFLPVDSIGGAAQSISLAGIFKKGGAVLFGATWSADSGDGFDDRCVIVSDQGEVAVYEGKNPASASDWVCVGVYDIGRPLGKKAWFNAGGDLVIATESGMVPMSQAVQKDPAALSLSSISRQIAPEWQREVEDRRSLPWEVAKWTAGNLLFVSLPRPSEALQKYTFAASTETGGWSRVVGWDTRCMAVHDDRMYFGSNAGAVYVADVGGYDDEEPYTATLVYNFDPMGAQGRTKTVHQARGVFRSSTPFKAAVSAFVDYQSVLPAAPSSESVPTLSLWDVAEWDVDTWDAGGEPTISANWVTVGRTGFVVAPRIQITSGNIGAPEIELFSVDLTYSVGGLVT